MRKTERCCHQCPKCLTEFEHRVSALSTELDFYWMPCAGCAWEEATQTKSRADNGREEKGKLGQPEGCPEVGEAEGLPGGLAEAPENHEEVWIEEMGEEGVPRSLARAARSLEREV